MVKRIKKICFVAPNADSSIGGIATWYRIISNSLPSDFSCSCISTDVIANPAKKKSFFSKYIRSFIKIFNQLRRLKTEIRGGCEILHIATSGGFGFYRDLKLLRLAKNNNLKTVLHLHFGLIPKILSKKRGLIYLLFKKCVKFADCIISIDRETELSLVNSGIKTKYIPNPVQISDYSYDIFSSTIIFVGHVIKTKGVQELVDAFSRFHIDHQDWKLEIVGPYDNSFIDQLIIDYPIQGINFVGPLPHGDTISHIKKSAFLILPSYTEGMPNVILEAMSCGTPCISTEVGNIREMIEGCGVLIKPKSSDEIFNAINCLTSNSKLRSDYSEKSYLRAKNNYSTQVIIKQLISIWEDNPKD